jgi:hypothetical protein
VPEANLLGARLPMCWKASGSLMLRGSSGLWRNLLRAACRVWSGRLALRHSAKALEFGLAGLQSADASSGRVNQTLSNAFGPLQSVSLLLRGIAVNPALRSSGEESKVPQELTELIDEGDNLGPGDEQSRCKFAPAL